MGRKRTVHTVLTHLNARTCDEILIIVQYSFLYSFATCFETQLGVTMLQFIPSMQRVKNLAQGFKGCRNAFHTQSQCFRLRFERSETNILYFSNTFGVCRCEKRPMWSESEMVITHISNTFGVISDSDGKLVFTIVAVGNHFHSYFQ